MRSVVELIIFTRETIVQACDELWPLVVYGIYPKDIIMQITFNMCLVRIV